MLQYQRVQPKLKALCAQYGLPYLQESVFVRVRKLVDIMVGRSSMKRVDSITKVADAVQGDALIEAAG